MRQSHSHIGEPDRTLYEMDAPDILDMLKRLKVPHADIARAIGRDRTAATKMLAGTRSIKVTEILPLTKLVEAALTEGVKPDVARPDRASGNVQYGRGSLPIRGPIQAGAWLEVNTLDQSVPKSWPASPDLRYPKANQWLSVVQGDSMNALTNRNGQMAGILEGDLVHMVDAYDIDYRPTTGDVVEVVRSRFDGRELEITLKQVEVVGRGEVLLWPRSDNPAFKDPLPYREDMRDDEFAEVRVRGKMLQVIRPFP